MYVEIEYKRFMFSTHPNKDGKGKEAVGPAAMDNSYMYKYEHPRSYWLPAFFFPQGRPLNQHYYHIMLCFLMAYCTITMFRMI